ncbi:DUF4870 domain-containing protein [Microbacterium oxydans]|uniref:DUF4870 domain-containing protein n=1 Tax=Microbacterium oxydans TaxID=82380 RepID=A0A0F0LA61_9MICO|nr:DUF4870 domain-containing protein [Microbacterium oxydans]KJL28456.1 hypothetical protein RS83_03529 [Microbacterium oxydans]
MTTPADPAPEQRFAGPAAPPPPPPAASAPMTPPMVPAHQAPAYQAPAFQAPGSPSPAPGYIAPGYPAPGYPAPGYPPVTPPRGLLPWVLGFLIFIPFPFLGGLASGIAMAVSGGASRRAGGPARENARSALNWGLTYLMISTLLLVLHVVVLFSLSGSSGATGFFPIGIPITIYFAISIVHVVLVIMGTVRVSSGAAMRVPFAIPFLRA